nr:MAG TPA: hypothetical protein [Caudoviricetes sp.]
MMAKVIYRNCINFHYLKYFINRCRLYYLKTI